MTAHVATLFPGHVTRALLLAALALGACGGTSAADSRYPARPPGCAVEIFRGKVAGLAYDDIGRADAICGNDIGEQACLDELRNQALGGSRVRRHGAQPSRLTPAHPARSRRKNRAPSTPETSA